MLSNLTKNASAQRDIQSLFDNAVSNSIAPGFQFVVFDKTHFVVNGVAGQLSLPESNTDGPIASPLKEGIPMTAEHNHWLASAGKIAVSIIALMILERGAAKNGISLSDLDNHEKLVEILPEFKLGSDSVLTKIIDGFEPKLNEKGQKVPILRDAKAKVTLRMLFTHTAGLSVMVRFGLKTLIEVEFTVSPHPVGQSRIS